jgi:hypothetical protein
MHIANFINFFPFEGDEIKSSLEAAKSITPEMLSVDPFSNTPSVIMRKTDLISPAYSMGIARELRDFNILDGWQGYREICEMAEKLLQNKNISNPKYMLDTYKTKNWHRYVEKQYTDGKVEFHSNYTEPKSLRKTINGKLFKSGYMLRGPSSSIPSYNLLRDYTLFHPGVVMSVKSIFQIGGVIDDSAFCCNEIVKNRLLEIAESCKMSKELIMKNADRSITEHSTDIITALLSNYGEDSNMQVNAQFYNGKVILEGFNIESIQGNRHRERHSVRIPQNVWNAQPEHVKDEGGIDVLDQPKGAGPQRGVNYSEEQID